MIDQSPQPIVQEVTRIASDLQKLLQRPSCAFAHELGWKFGGYQQPSCEQNVKHQNLLCAHNAEGNSAVVEAIKFLSAQGVITSSQLERLLGVLTEGTGQLYSADIRVHYAALRQMLRDGSTLCSSDRADAISKTGVDHEVAFLEGAAPSQRVLEERARAAQETAGAPIKQVVLLFLKLLSEVAETEPRNDSSGNLDPLRKKVDRFLNLHDAGKPKPVGTPWCNLVLPSATDFRLRNCGKQ